MATSYDEAPTYRRPRDSLILLREAAGRIIRIFPLRSREGRQRVGLVLWLALAAWLVRAYYFWGPAGRNPVGSGDWSLPALGEAFFRGLAGLWGVALVLAVAHVLGGAVCRLVGLEADDQREELLFRFGLGLGVLASGLLVLAWMGFYTPAAVGALTATVLIGGLGVFVCRQRAAGQRISLRPRRLTFRREQESVWKAVAAAAILCSFIGALAPEREYDALWYHLGLPQIWLDEGHLVDLPHEFVSLYPMTWELLFGASMVLGGQVAAKLLHFACLPLICLIAYQLTHRYFPNASPWLAVTCLAATPIVLWEGSTAYNDLAVALHVGLAVYALLRFSKGRAFPWLLAAGLNLGFALGTKHLAFFALVLLVPGLALGLWAHDRRIHQALRPALGFGLMAFVPALPWWVRSYVATGNPVFPLLYEIFGAPRDRWSVITEQGLDRFLAGFGPQGMMDAVLLPWDMTVHAFRYGGTLGPAFMLLIPCLLFGRHRDSVTPWLLGFVIGFIALWASPISSFQMRFLVPITPLLSVLAAEGFARLTIFSRSLSSWVPATVAIGVMVILLLNLPPFIPWHEADRRGYSNWLTHVLHPFPLAVTVGAVTEADYLERTVPSYAAWRFINRELPADAKILTFSGGDHFYSDRQRLWANATAAHEAVWGSPVGQEDEALRALEDENITHVLLDKRELVAQRHSSPALVQRSIRASWYQAVYEDARFIVLRLRRHAIGLRKVSMQLPLTDATSFCICSSSLPCSRERAGGARGSFHSCLAPITSAAPNPCCGRVESRRSP